jgi:predicted ATP-binding protein involved in virulence
MTNTVTISGTISPSTPAAEIGVEVWVDNTCVINVEHVDHTVIFKHDIADDDAEHEFRIVMKHKQLSHTQLDQDNNIVQDAMLTVSDIAFDDIQLGQILSDLSVYTHDFNGTQPQFQDKFYGDMGCNGTVSLKFTTPLYLWMLEHM